MSGPGYCVQCGRHVAALDPAGLCPTCAVSRPSGPSVMVAGTSAPAGRLFPDEASVPLAWQPGDVLVGRYEVRGTLGAGAMGTVYRVHHRGWGVDLAVKVPQAGMLDRPHGAALFVAEATAWVELGLYPHVVARHYVRTLGGVPRVFAELVDGGSLQEWIADGRLYAGGEPAALTRILDVAIQVLWGLAHAHQSGLVHQDVKPANVLLTPAATAKVTDFGLAVTTGGTPAYLSPEQADAIAEAGKGVPVEGRTAVRASSDLWSWALVVLDMFDGEPEPRRPGQAGALALAALPDRGPARPDVPTMPAPLHTLLGRCFLEPDERPDTETLSDGLAALYAEAAGRPYPRQRPRAADLRADSLTNKGVSLLDLGHEAEARAAWAEALADDAHHLEAGYDVELSDWRHGLQPDDRELVTRIDELGRRHPHDARALLMGAQVHVERGDPEAALACLDEVERQHVADADLRHTREVARGLRRVWVGSRETVGGTIHALAALPGSGDVVAAHDDGRLRVWDGEGRCSTLLPGHRGGAYAVDVSPDGRRVASTGSDGTVRVWRPGTAEAVAAIDVGGPQYAVSWSPDGTRVACGGDDNHVRVLDVRSGREVARLDGHRAHVTGVRWHPTDGTLVTAGHDKTIRVWNLDGTCLRRLEGHRGDIRALVLDRDGSRALTGSGMPLQFTGDETARVWDLARGTCVRVLSGHLERVTGLVLLPDGQLVTGSYDGTVRVWDLTTGQCRRTIIAGGRGVTAMVRSGAGLLVVATVDGHLQHWDLSDIGRIRAPWALCRPGEIEQMLRSTSVVAGARERAARALAGGRVGDALESVRRARATPGYERDRELLALWHEIGSQGARRTGLRGAYRRDEVEAHENGVGALALAPDGSTAATVGTSVDLGSSRRAAVWDLGPATARLSLECGSGGRAAAFTPDGRHLLVGCGDVVREWDVRTGDLVRTLAEHTSDVLALAVSPDGRWCASGSAGVLGAGAGTLLLWDLGAGTVVRRLEGHTRAVSCVAFDADGSRLLSGSHDRSLRIWDLGTGDCLVCDGHRKAVNAVVATPDRRHVLTASDDASVRLWDLRTGRVRGVLRGHKLGVTALALSGDGDFAFTGSTDTTIRVWPVLGSRPLLTLDGHRAEVTGLAVTADSRALVSAGLDRSLRTWDLDWEYTYPDGTAGPGEEQ